MPRTSEDDYRTVADRYDRLVRILRRETASRTGYPAGWRVPQEVNGLLSRVSTGGSELFEVLGATDERDRKTI